MKLFANVEVFEKPVNFDEHWYEDKEFGASLLCVRRPLIKLQFAAPVNLTAPSLRSRSRVATTGRRYNSAIAGLMLGNTNTPAAAIRLLHLNLARLRSLRENVNWEIEKERLELLDRLEILFIGWMSQLPNLQEIFQKGEIDRLLSDSVSHVRYRSLCQTKLFVEFVAETGYKNEPDADEGGKIWSRCTTAVHRVAQHPGLLKYIILDELFKIFNRFDVNYTDKSGLSHFHVACKFDIYHVVRKFLEAGQDPNCRWQKTGDSPLHLALAQGCCFLSELLLKNGADPNVANTAGLTPLHIISMRKNCLDFAKMLFELSDPKYQPLQVNVLDKYNQTPLYKALLRGHRKLVEFLLRRGANPHLANVARLTPLHAICGGKRDDYSLAKMLRA
ncbi:unnamed protein product [Trichogramma brassicae]|uniref:Uncharacterized protein n=1 Tax=Trichogramma brassicae TaxID=86971 RepID=A0A6H5IXB4_9HYME|nr:unnamed protein product [Trichogramma brassicae]